jgi:DNA-binding FadR family transcriptional regulator
MATGKKDGDRATELEAAIEKIRKEIWKPGQTLPKLRRAIALILQGTGTRREADADLQRHRVVTEATVCQS